MQDTPPKLIPNQLPFLSSLHCPSVSAFSVPSHVEPIPRTLVCTAITTWRSFTLAGRAAAPAAGLCTPARRNPSICSAGRLGDRVHTRGRAFGKSRARLTALFAVYRKLACAQPVSVRFFYLFLIGFRRERRASLYRAWDVARS